MERRTVKAEAFLHGFLEKMAQIVPAGVSGLPDVRQFEDLMIKIHKDPDIPPDLKNAILHQLERQQLPPPPGTQFLSGIMGGAGALLAHILLRGSRLPMAAHAPLVGLGFGAGHMAGERLLTPTVESTRGDFSDQF